MQKDSQNPQLSEGAKRRETPWSLERRLQFIDWRLRWQGVINRRDLCNHFGISVPQASNDIAKYLEVAPGNAEYSHVAREYVVLDSFTPAFPGGEPQDYLSALLAGSKNVPNPFGTPPPVANVHLPARVPEEGTLRSITQAIRDTVALEITYQSRDQDEPSQRTVTPHSLAVDGHRWHVRAYCHQKLGFRDFVLARILKVGERAAPQLGIADDSEWNTEVDIVLEPNPVMSATQRQIVEREYGMVDGRLILPCRQALVFYLVQHLGLNTASEEDLRRHWLVLTNRKALKPHFIKQLAESTDAP